MNAIYYKTNHRQVRYTSYDQFVYTYCYLYGNVKQAVWVTSFVYARYFVVWESHKNWSLVTYSSSLGAGKYY